MAGEEDAPEWMRLLDPAATPEMSAPAAVGVGRKGKVQACECGNFLMPDAQFCRKCGTPRAEEAATSDEAGAGDVADDATPEDELDENTLVSPSVLLDKLERLLQEGTELIRYTPTDGKGWGVSGELDEEWHSFRERGNGSCTYEDQMLWWTGVPESGWSIAELASLEDLRKRAQELPQAELPTAATNPELFTAEAGAARSSGLVAMAAARRNPAPVAGPGELAERAAAAAPPQIAEGGVPLSRTERLKQRLQAQKDYALQQEVAPSSRVSREDFKRAAAKAAATRGRASVTPMPPAVAAAPAASAAQEEDEDFVGDGPTMQEEVSAATFLSAVKSRLIEWGKVDQYHEFVVALTGDAGDVDVRNCVRILRGHDDLLRVFKYKFAPDADLIKVKAELSSEPQEERAAPSAPRLPQFQAVKAEAGVAPRPAARRGPSGGPTPPSAPPGAEGPRPPPGPPTRGVKRELVKGEVKTEDVVPRPPKLPPGARRGVVTIGDDSDEDDELQDEASIAAAVRKGRDECIAHLAKLIFRKERSVHDGARERLATVRYATKRAACPRFPRELFILRGAPGVGKTDYAMQQLADAVSVDADEELAARLTHVCSADDFFEHFQGSEATYKFSAGKVEAYLRKNEMRVRLAMEAGIHPLYVDSPNMRLWEMRPFVELADRLGYVTTIIEPQDICEKCDDLAYLFSANDTAERRTRGKVANRGLIAALLKVYEPLHGDLGSDGGFAADPLARVRTAKRPVGPQTVEAIPVPPLPPPSGAVRGRVGPSSAPVQVGRRVPPPRAPGGAKRPAPPGAGAAKRTYKSPAW